MIRQAHHERSSGLSKDAGCAFERHRAWRRHVLVALPRCARFASPFSPPWSWPPGAAARNRRRSGRSPTTDRLFTVGADIYDSCSACHQKYMDAIVNANK
jgi:hypothetical protein